MCEEDSIRPSQLNSCSMMCGFNAACFDSYTRSHPQADGTPKKNYDIHALRVVPRKSTPCVSSSQRGRPT